MGRLIATKGFHLYSFDEHGLQRKWKKRKLDEKLPVVCQQCNNNWMSDLENQHAKPAIKDLILSDKPTTLTVQRLDSIAKFAFKTAVVADHYSMPDRPFFTSAARYAFRNSFAIPRGVQMWISALKESGHGTLRAFYYSTSTEARYGVELYTLTFGAGYFLVQIVGSRWLDPHNTPGGFPVLTSGKFWNRFSTPFWPTNGQSIRWPLDKQFNLVWLNRFCMRWSNINAPTEWFKVD